MTIPANTLVNVAPSVLSAGGVGLATNGLVLTTNTRVPVGTVASFPNGSAVTSYFGSGTKESTIANGGAGLGSGYFGGFTGASQTPGAILFAQFTPSAVAAYIRGGNISSLTLAQLQGINGTLDIVIDGYAHNASALDLSSATSFSSAAGLIATAINGSLANAAQVTATIAPETASFTASISGNVMTVTAVASGTIVVGSILSGTGVTSGTQITGQLSGTAGGIGTYAVTPSQVTASTTITGSYGELTVSAVASGTVSVGQSVTGSGVTNGTLITALGSGTGADGTYFVNLTQTVGSETLTMVPASATVAYDSTSGAFVITSGIAGPASTIAFATGSTAASLGLTQATGAVLSQGAAGMTPATFMNALIIQNQNWVAFMTAFDPDGGSGGGNAGKQAFAAWKNTQNDRFGYVCWDSDPSPTNTLPATSSLGYILNNNGDSGTFLLWEGSDLNHAAFILGATAAINFNATAGRISMAYKTQPNLLAAVTDPTIAANLGGNPQAVGQNGNGYNFVGAYATASPQFTWLQRGFCTGPFAWWDSYINQIWFNYSAQIALLQLEQNSNSVPYDIAGAGMIESALQPTISNALNFGMFGPPDPGSISQEQINEIATIVGSGNSQNVANALYSQGYYLFIGSAASTVKAGRASPPLYFFYIDNGSIQALSLNSVALN